MKEVLIIDKTIDSRGPELKIVPKAPEIKLVKRMMRMNTIDSPPNKTESKEITALECQKLAGIFIFVEFN